MTARHLFVIDPRVADAPPRGLYRHVAGGYPWRSMPPLEDPRALADPLGVVAQRGEVLVANHVVGHVAAHADHLDPHQVPHSGTLGQIVGLVRLGNLARHIHFTGKTGDTDRCI